MSISEFLECSNIRQSCEISPSFPEEHTLVEYHVILTQTVIFAEFTMSEKL